MMKNTLALNCMIVHVFQILIKETRTFLFYTYYRCASIIISIINNQFSFSKTCENKNGLIYFTKT